MNYTQTLRVTAQQYQPGQPISFETRKTRLPTGRPDQNPKQRCNLCDDPAWKPEENPHPEGSKLHRHWELHRQTGPNVHKGFPLDAHVWVDTAAGPFRVCPGNWIVRYPATNAVVSVFSDSDFRTHFKPTTKG